MAFTAGQFKSSDHANVLDPQLPSSGTAIHADADMDPDSIYTDASGLNMGTASTDYAPKHLFRSIIVLGGAGQTAVTLKVAYANGSYITFTFSVDANSFVEFEGQFRGIYKTGTTAVGVYPLF